MAGKTTAQLRVQETYAAYQAHIASGPDASTHKGRLLLAAWKAAQTERADEVKAKTIRGKHAHEVRLKHDLALADELRALAVTLDEVRQWVAIRDAERAKQAAEDARKATLPRTPEEKVADMQNQLLRMTGEL